MTNFKCLEKNEIEGNLYYISIYGWNGFISFATLRSKMRKPTYEKLYNELREDLKGTKKSLHHFKIMQAIRRYS